MGSGVRCSKDADVFKMKIIQLNKLMSGMAYDGEWRPVFDYFAEEVKAQTSIRDYLEG